MIKWSCLAGKRDPVRFLNGPQSCFNHSKIRHKFVRYSHDSGIPISAIQTFTLCIKLSRQLGPFRNLTGQHSNTLGPDQASLTLS
jgi:hypothetical protein